MSKSNQRWYLVVSYDIADDRRRTEAAQFVLRFGERVQASVYDCLVDDEQIARLKDGLEAIIDGSVDSVRYYCLCASCERRVSVQGVGDVRTDDELVVI